MVVLLGNKNSKIEKEILEILSKYKEITVQSFSKAKNIQSLCKIAVFCNNAKEFESLILDKKIIGICENANPTALKVFQKSEINVISCGINSKNTVTISSLTENNISVTLQRTVTDFCGIDTEPCEITVKLTKSYNPYSVMASTAILILYGIKATVF